MKCSGLFALLLLAVSIGQSQAAGEWVIPDEMRVCTQDADCELWESDCSGCCDYTSANKNYHEAVKTLFTNACKNYRGAVCDCATLGIPTPRCSHGTCVIIDVPRN